MNEKLLLVSSHNDILDTAHRLEETMGCSLRLICADLEEAAAKAGAILAIEPRYIIISRGGTAKLLRERYPDTPIVEIKVNGYDLLRVLYPLAMTGKKAAVIGFENAIRGADHIAETIGMEILYLPIAQEYETDKKIGEATQAGVDVVVGDGLAIRKAQKCGIDTVFVPSGWEAVELAVEEAMKLYNAMELERLHNRMYRTILESLDEGVISVDEKGRVDLFNPSAEKIFQISRAVALHKKIEDLIPYSKMPDVLSGKNGTELGDIQRTGKYIISTNRIPIVMDGRIKGVVSTFQDITKIQQLEEKIRVETIKKGLHAKKTFQDLIYQSEIMEEVVTQAKEYAQTDSTILIYGETGTGKEIMAQALHTASPRSFGPFVAINCAALPGSLLESELFGYVDGAFTGARTSGKKGLFELAHRGTIFLDEISEMDLQVQARLLRVIQEKEVMRIGDDKVLPIDIRIIAATNKKLWNCVQSHSFRQDLFYRINVLNLHLPPLRHRKEDILLLAGRLIKNFGETYGKMPRPLTSAEQNALLESLWPGNVRELQNVMERFVVSGKLQLDQYTTPHANPNEIDTRGTLGEIEASIIKKVLAEENFHKSNAAKRLGITRTTLDKKIK